MKLGDLLEKHGEFIAVDSNLLHTNVLACGALISQKGTLVNNGDFVSTTLPQVYIY